MFVIYKINIVYIILYMKIVTDKIQLVDRISEARDLLWFIKWPD